MSSTWSSGVGKFKKKDPDHGKWWKKIKHWLCKVGLCNLDKCKSSYHKDKCCGKGCKDHANKDHVNKDHANKAIASGHCQRCGCLLKVTGEVAGHWSNDYCKDCADHA